ncbi:MAG: hypothetical protein ABII90_04495 [Bacteroidota bacterium]
MTFTRNYILICILSIFSLSSCGIFKKTNGTERSDKKKNKQVTKIISCPDSSIFYVTEVKPEFPGGKSELLKYFKDNIEIPVEYEKMERNFRFDFTLDCNGKAIDPMFHSLRDKEINQQLESLIQKMPTWKPARQGKENVFIKMCFVLKIVNENLVVMNINCT